MSIFAKIGLFLSLSVFSALVFPAGPAVVPEGPNPMMQIVFFGGFILIFYFLMWRPQSKRTKEHKNLVSGLSKGDEIITNGGIAGKISKVTDDFIRVEVAEGVEIKIQKVAISSALPKGTLKNI